MALAFGGSVLRLRTLAVLVIAAGLSGLAALGAWIITTPHRAFAEQDAHVLDAGDPGRGKRIFDGGACASCHAKPGQGDRLALGGGMALLTPFGIFYPPNISMDRTDGIGAWSSVDIANAVVSGVSPGGKHYYPALPYVVYTHMRTEDVADLIAYMRTLPAVNGSTPPHDLPQVFKVRRAIGFWKLLYFDHRKPIDSDPARGEAWNRGHYLVEGVSHCAQCHSAHNLLNAVKESARFAGGIDQTRVGFVPNITPAGIGHWSEPDIVEALTSGWTPEGRKIGSSMADMVVNTAALPEQDRAAIATYLKSLPARTSPEAPKAR